MDRYKSAMNAMLFGPSPSQEVTASDSWDRLTTDDPAAPERYYHRGQGVRVHKNHITVRHDEYKWVPNEKAISELRALMGQWETRGWSSFVDSVETHEGDDEEPESYEVYESLGHSKTVTTYIKIPLANVKFYRDLPHDPAKGMSSLITEPRHNARITGLGTSPFEG